MRSAAALLASALAALLVFVQPFAGRRRYRRLLDRLTKDPGARLAHYRRGIAGEWIGVVLIALVGVLAGRSAQSIGLRAPEDGWDSWFAVGEIAVLLGVSTIVMRRPALREVLRRQAKGFIALLPATDEERRTFVGLALTAGVCEEVIYRGFLMSYTAWLFPDVTDGWLVLIVAVAFGFAHAYQGLRGILLTGLVGIGLGAFVVSSNSLVPAIVVHALIDLRILALPDLTSPDPPAASAAPAPSAQ